VCMGRALMIPAYLGSNIEGVLNPSAKAKVSGSWDKLPASVAEFGATAEELFAGYYDLQKKVGKDEMKKVPLGAVAFWTLADKLAAGLQQLMAGTRRFSLKAITREDIFSANRQTEKETGVPFITDAADDKAKKILKEN